MTAPRKSRKARNPWFRDANGNRCRKILESPKASAARMERNIQRDTCGLGHWRQPDEWDKEPFSHTVTMVTDWTGHMGGWQIYNSGVTVALISHPIAGPFVRGVPYVWCKQARNGNGTSGTYPTAPLFGRFIELSGDRPRVLSGKATSAVLGADYVYCYRAVGHVGYGSEQYARSEIPIPIPSAAVRQDGPAAFDILQHAAKRLDELISNLCEVTDMADELAEAEKKAGTLTADAREHIEARAYRALQPIINAAMAQSGQMGAELADYLNASPSLAHWLARWQGDDAKA
jgi:hypothetical protein